MKRRPTTSADSPLQVGWLVPERLGLTFAPGKWDPDGKDKSWARDMSEDLDRLVRVHGAKTLVSLIKDYELELLRIPDLMTGCERVGLELIRFPIVDGEVPGDIEEVRALVGTIVARVKAGGTVVVHCRGGLGRAGTIGGCALVGLGKTASAAFPILIAARGKSCPENESQRAFIRQFEESSKEKPPGSSR